MSKAPQYLGSYRIGGLLAGGHATQIWQAYHEGKKIHCVVKTPIPGHELAKEQTRLLKWEYQVAGKMAHDRIVQVWEYGIHKGLAYLAMEWVQGANLKQRLRQGPEVLAPMATKIAYQAAEAVAYFNSQGWVHCDIKPDNFVLSDKTNELKLIDFAIARRPAGILARLWPFRSKKVQGTRSYISPEQLGGGAIDDRADVYSLACMLFELVAGKPPFTATTAEELLQKQLRSAPPVLETLNRNVTPEFSRLIRSSLAKKPDERPSSSVEFYRQLAKIRIFRIQPKATESAKE